MVALTVLTDKDEGESVHPVVLYPEEVAEYRLPLSTSLQVKELISQ